MRTVLIGSAILLVTVGAGFAADDPMANYYGNTVISKGASGESHAHYKPDGTFDATLSGAMGSMNTTGTWKLDDKGELCRTYNNAPPGMTGSFCTAWGTHQVGDTWTIELNGQPRTVSLVKGIQ
jgi:hypothetical protein